MLLVIALLAFGPIELLLAAPVKVAVLKFGTVNWELDVVRHHGLAKAEGVELEVMPVASKRASDVALQAGTANVVVGDWIWVTRQRAAGRRFTFVPYSSTIGALIARPDAGIATLADLRGKKLGVAGGPVDKSWLMLRAVARRDFDLDLPTALEPSFAAPPVLNRLVTRGDLDAVVTFWHYAARLRAEGLASVVEVVDLLPKLGATAEVPMLGWIFNEAWAAENEAAVVGFLRASYAAKRLLAESDAEWERIAPLLKAPDASAREALRDAYRAGIPRRFGEPEQASAAHLFTVLANEGGKELVGDVKALEPGTFWKHFDVQAFWR